MKTKYFYFVYFTALTFIFQGFESYSQIWVNALNIPSNGTQRYLGDYVNFTYQFEIGQSSWNASQVGVISQTDFNGGNNPSYFTANYYEDGGGSNKRVRTIFNADGGANESFQFTTVDD